MGACALVAVVWRVGPLTLWNGLLQAGWGFAGMCAFHLTGLALDALALRQCAGSDGRRVEGTTFLRACIAGHAVNLATPLGQLGELTRYAVLAERLEPTRVAATVLGWNLVRFVATCATFAAAQPVCALLLGLQAPARTAFGLSAVFFALLAGVAAVLLWRGPGELPFRIARRLGVAPERVERAAAWWRQVETITRRESLEPRQLALAVAYSIASAATMVGEVAVLLWAMDHARGHVLAWLVVSSGQIVQWATSFVPLQAGTAEGGAYVVFGALGLSPAAGVLVELVKRARWLVFVTLGMLVLGRQAFRLALSPAPGAGSPRPAR